MLRSMFSGVAGLRNHQVKMDVLANNIANVNTYGFKASRTVFQEMYNQTMKGASAPSGNVGGVNPQQIGLGVSTAAVEVLFTNGATQTTDRQLDLSIKGEGMFVVQKGELPGDGNFYTRAGNFYIDPSSGFLVTANGLYVQGVMFEGVFDVYDAVDGQDAFCSSPILEEEVNTMFAGGGNGTGLTNEEAYDSQYLGRIWIPPGFVDIAIDDGGVIKGMDAENNMVIIGRVALAKFDNQAGLERVGDNLYRESTNSGVATYNVPGNGNTSSLQSGSLEMSNVDLSKEFTEMIITQRGFQANSRIITVSDTLLEELVNLKR